MKAEETILLADDESDVRDAMKIILEEFGFMVIEAVDGEDAIKKFTEHSNKIHLLLFDIMMPKKSGLEAFEEIRKMAPRIKAVFISGYTGNIIRAQRIHEEDLNFISKPVQPNELIGEIRRVLKQ